MVVEFARLSLSDGDTQTWLRPDSPALHSRPPLLPPLGHEKERAKRGTVLPDEPRESSKSYGRYCRFLRIVEGHPPITSIRGSPLRNTLLASW
jgi:hypothetical protein